MPRKFLHFVSRVGLIAAIVSSITMPAVASTDDGNSSSTSSSLEDGSKTWIPNTPQGWPLVVSSSQSSVETLTSGVEHFSKSFQTVGGPLQANVLSLDLSNPNVKLGVVAANDKVYSADETVSSMANRTGAVGGINGDMFAIHGTGAPLNMEIANGKILQSPMKGNYAILGVTKNGQLAISPENFSASATLTSGNSSESSSFPIASINRPGTESGGNLTLITPDLGAPFSVKNATVVYLKPTSNESTTQYTLDNVQTNVSQIPQLKDEVAMVAGGGNAATWLSSSVQAGETVSISENLSPDDNLEQAIGAAYILLKDGQPYTDTTAEGEGAVKDVNPLTAVGVTKDGKHAFMVAFDGRESGSVGLTYPQMASYLQSLGAYNAVVLDGGGSTEMVVRHPGDISVSVVNTPSDGGERQVSNGLFVYSTESAVSAVSQVVVNQGKPVTLLDGTTIPVDSYALDNMSNPVETPIQYSVDPSDLVKISGHEISPLRAGHGELVATAGNVQTRVPFTVVDKLATLSVSPDKPDLSNGQTQQFTLTATSDDGQNIPVPPQAAHWSVAPATLGSFSDQGDFTAGSSGEIGTVTASAGGVSASASVAVGQVAKPIGNLTGIQDWSVVNQYMNVYPRKVPVPGTQSTPNGGISFSTDVKHDPSDAGSLDLHYNFPGGQQIYDLNAYPNDPSTYELPVLDGTLAPTAIGMWVKGSSNSDPAKPLDQGALSLTLGFYQDNNMPINMYPAAVTSDGWTYVVGKLPDGMQFPLRLNYLGLVIINPKTNLTGDVYISDLQALYSPRLPETTPYVPVPDNPKWLQFESSPSDFRNDGITFASFDDAHTVASDTSSTGSVTLKMVEQQIQSMPSAYRPTFVQTQGDMVDAGTLDNFNYLDSIYSTFGIPVHSAVGNHEITQGASPENQNYASVFGPTHYTYTAGKTQFIVLDNAHGGLLSSDPYQNPSDEQYQWLVNTLNQDQSKVTFVVMHMPAYDPHPVKNSQMSDRYEAEMFEKLIKQFQDSHPEQHVVLLFGHARGYAENLLNENGTNEDSGLPNFVVADTGVPAYAPVDEGGFYNYVLFHVTDNGNVQFAVRPVLTKIDVLAPQTDIQVGQTISLSATGTTPNGDDLQPVQIPIQNPVSHVWSSSDPHIASVDPTTGKVIALRSGTVTIQVEADNIQGSVNLTVH